MIILRRLGLLVVLMAGLACPVGAGDQFRTSIITDYRFDSSGKAAVEHRVSLINKISSVYPSSYQMKLRGVSAPRNLAGSDDFGPLKITTQNFDPDVTVITVEPNQAVTGKGETTRFTLTYATDGASKSGQVWQIILPKLALDAADEYQLNIFVPDAFGQLAYMSPIPKDALPNTESGTMVYTFTKDQLTGGGVSAAFGHFQVLDFTLTYHLRNDSRSGQLLSLALPPDTSYQRLFYTSLTPQPERVAADGDGNWLAFFRLGGKQSLSVVAVGQAHLLPQPVPVGEAPSAQMLAAYTRPTGVWQSDDAKIKAQAAKLTTPRAIYDYVVDTLDYDYTRAASASERRGSVGSLALPTASLCREFTDLFIALARAAGIPARELNGFALSSDPRLQPISLLADVLHAWPEYWDEQFGTWRAVDPTWTDTSGGEDFFTKLDLAHFVFAIHGTDSDKPLPAGLYKLDPDSKDVEVKVGQFRHNLTRPLTLAMELPGQFLPFWSNTASLGIHNPNGIAFYNVPIFVTSTMSLFGTSYPPLPVLPPFATAKVPISIPSGPVPVWGPKILSAQSMGASISYNIPEYAFFTWYALITAALTCGIFIVASLTHWAWSLLVQRRLRPPALRG